MSDDDELRARAEAFIKQAAIEGRSRTSEEWLADFAAAEVDRALVEERAKAEGFPDACSDRDCLNPMHHSRHCARMTRVRDHLPCDCKVRPLASTGMASEGRAACKPWCGTTTCSAPSVIAFFSMFPALWWCTFDCRHARRPLNPAPNLSPGLKSDAEHECMGDPCEECGEMYSSQADREAVDGAQFFVPPDDRAALMADTVDARDKKPRDKGCRCHWEEGDSPCPVHPSEDDTIPPNEAAGNVPAPATTGPTAAGVPQRTGGGPGPEGSPAAPALAWLCNECGLGVAADEDGCCVHCGQDCAKFSSLELVGRCADLEDERDALKARVAELEAEKAAAVLAERGRVIEAIIAEHDKFKQKRRHSQFDAADIRAAGEAAPK